MSEPQVVWFERGSLTSVAEEAYSLFSREADVEGFGCQGIGFRGLGV